MGCRIILDPRSRWQWQTLLEPFVVMVLALRQYHKSMLHNL